MPIKFPHVDINHIVQKIKAIIWKKCIIINKIQAVILALIVKWYNKSLVRTSSLVSTGWEHHDLFFIKFFPQNDCNYKQKYKYNYWNINIWIKNQF